MWSEKSGCTAIVKWFFWQLDLLDEAVKHHPWVHNYENDVFKKRPGYTHDYLKAINDGLPVLKFVRNPYRRAYSGYLEVCNQKIAQPPAHWTKDYRKRILNAIIGPGCDLEYGFSFRQYCQWLVNQEADSLDLHIRPQRVPFEELLNLRVHKIEAGHDAILKLEKEFGLKSSIKRPDLMKSEHHNPKFVLDPRPAASVFDLAVPVRRTRQFEVVEPTIEEFRAHAVGADIRRFFADDFIHYGYQM